MGLISLSNKQVRIGNRKICLADTPESRLKYLDTNEIDKLAAIGVNGISATVFGGDVTDITPFIGNDYANGIDFAKLADWYKYLSYAQRIKKIVPFLMLSEKENHFKLNSDQEKWTIKELVKYFSDLSIIWTKEEYPTGNNSRLRDVYTMLKSEIKTQGANHLIALHNNTDEVNYTGNNDLIDLIQLQTKLATGNASIKKAYDAGFAVFQSELVGGSASSDWRSWCSLGQGMSSGAGAYFSADDLKAPQYVNDELKYKSVYQTFVQELGTTQPTKSKVTFQYNPAKVNLIIE